MSGSAASTTPLSAVAISGSPSRESKSRQLLMHALTRLSAAGADTCVVDLCELPADDLLGRGRSAPTSAALSAVDAARVLVVGTPVYRASYSGLLKTFFDLLPPDALAQKVAIAVATGGGPGHQLVLDHALRPLLSSVGALIVSTAVYGMDSQFGAAGPHEVLTTRVDRAVDEALTLAGRISSTHTPDPLSHVSR
jgi:FMN reductase